MESTNFFTLRTISWNDRRNSVKLIDQTLLPRKLQFIECSNVKSLVHAIKSMQIRGAPAIGVAGAMGVALSMIEGRRAGLNEKALYDKVRKDALQLENARPTAVNLTWGVREALKVFKSISTKKDDIATSSSRLIEFVKKLAEEDVASNKRLSAIGQKLFPKNSSVLTHCN
jgi:methylthioribose-1-phosphate isomerase